jgi:proteasome lid subunit RPN8/RPN11
VPGCDVSSKIASLCVYTGWAIVMDARAVTLPCEVERAILAHARQSAPHECCGLLIGKAEAVVDVSPAANIAEDPERRYRINPSDHFRAIRSARQRSLDVVGAYHSHPRSTATPSQTDRADGFGDFIFLIVGLATEPPDVAAWTWSDGNFTTLPIVRLS